MRVRLISSAVGIAVALVVLFLHETFLFPLALAAINCLLLYELIRAVGAQGFWLSKVSVLVFAAVSPFQSFYSEQVYSALSGLPVLWTLFDHLFWMCLLLIFVDLLMHSQTFTVEQVSFEIMCMFLVPHSIGELITLHGGSGTYNPQGLVYVVLGLCGAWIADSGAYFTGITLGKHKLCPHISPKKTVEGLIGGVICNALVTVLICGGYVWIQSQFFDRYVPFGVGSGIRAAFLGVICALAGVVGDLCASVLKRQKGVKDFGTIMPGHGGLMDRFDSVLFVLPAFSVCVRMFPIFQ